jgi:hypothetical protein
MQHIIIVLTAFLLLLGQGSAWADAAVHAIDSIAVSDHLESMFPETPELSASGPLQGQPGTGFDSDPAIPDLAAVSVWNYTVTPRVAIDLACRPFDPQELGTGLVKAGLDVEQLTKNILVGIRYKF